MLTTKDVNKLIDAMKAFFYTKEEMDSKFAKVYGNFGSLRNSLKGFDKLGNKNKNV